MDPNETLRKIRSLIKLFNITGRPNDMDQLVDAFQALDESLAQGGVLPDDWSKVRVGMFMVDRKDEGGLEE